MTTTINTLRRSRWPWQNSLQWRLVSIILLVVLIPVVVIIAFNFLQTADILQKNTADDAQSLGTSVTAELERYLFQRRGDIQVLSNAEILWGLDNTPAIKLAYLKTYQDAYATYESFYVADFTGQMVVATDSTTGDQSDQEWFKSTLASEAIVLSDVHYLDTAKANVLTISAPIVNADGATVGIVAANISVQKLVSIISSTKVSNNGDIFVVNKQGLIVIDPDANNIFRDVNSLTGLQAALQGHSSIVTATNPDGKPALLSYAPDKGLESWVTVVSMPTGDVYAPIQDLALRSVIRGILAVIIIIVAVLFVARRVVQPIQQLTKVAGRLSAGDFHTDIPVHSADEIGQLAHTFRVMGRELQGMVDTLEERVEDRTRDLATTIEVGKLANSISSQQELLPPLVEYIRSKFDLYYTQIYLIDETGRYAVLRAGTGEVGQQLLARQHKLDLEETSLVARAVKTREAVVVSDTESNVSHKPNALLPATRSETTIPLQVGDVVLGVLDMQASRPNTFTQENASVFEALGGQIAAVLRGSQTFDEVKQSEEDARSTQTFLDSIIENIPNMVFVKNADDLRFVSLNKAGEELLGFKRETMIGKNDYDFYPKEQADWFTAKDREVLASDAVVDIPEELIQAAGGVDRYLHTKKIPVLDAHGKARFLLGISEDITERKEAQAALVESESRYRQIIEEATDVVYTIDPAGFFTYLSPSAKRMTGFEPDELVGKHFTVLLPKGEGWSKRLIEFYLNQVEQKILQTSLSFPILTSRGERRWVEQKVTLSMQRGSIVGLHSVTRDVTDRKQAEEELLLRNQAVEESRNRAELLGLVNAALSQAIDDEQILTAISVVIEGEEVRRTSLAFVESNNQSEIVSAEVVASRSGDGDIIPLDALPSTTLPAQYYTMMNQWNLGLQTPIYIEDVLNDPEVDEHTREYLKSAGTGALIAVPLRTGDEWQAIVFFAWSEAHVISSGLREMIESTMPTAASVVATRRSYLQTLIAREQAERRSLNMEAVAQVSATATTILDVDELLKTVSNLTKNRFGLYHAHIYLLDESGENLVLAAGAGEAGDLLKEYGHYISMDSPTSLVVQAALQRQAVIVNDVTATPGFLPNVLLPGTRSELALPMVVAGKLIGVLDVQDNTFNRFTDEDVRVQTALANQVAVAVENGRAFQEQQKTAERLREVDRLKSQFLANMSHELRTPLNSIIGYSEVLLDGLDGELNAEATEDVEAIHGGGKHLLTIINDILDLAKIEAGQMFLETRETNIMGVVEDVMNTCDILARNKGLELKVNQQADIPNVKGDAIRLKQIILNLVNNAIKFTETGSITIDLARDENQMLKVRIIDTGMGMTPDELAGLFQQFHQVDGSPTRRAGGTGLGLVITRHLVSMHGGVVDVESEKGTGTTFWFTVPVFKRSTQTVNRVISSAN